MKILKRSQRVWIRRHKARLLRDGKFALAGVVSALAITGVASVISSSAPVSCKVTYTDTIIKTVVVTATPTPVKKSMTKSEIVSASRYPSFIDHIWERESGRGTNLAGLAGRCAAKGMTNEFGYYPQGKWCFKTFAEAVTRIERWREKEAGGLSDSQALCYYNGAGKVNSCAYLTYNFKAMN